jgi:uncharacterized RDD family membrane protein YckC/transcriptional regulator CtsR
MAGDNRRSRFGAAGRLAFFPARVAARASRGPLEAAADEHLVPELSRLIDRALSQSLPEELVQSLVEHHVVERMATEFAASGELDRLVDQALASPRADELVDKIVNSEEMRRAIREIVSSKEVRDAVTAQTAGFAEELAGEVRAGARRVDNRVGRKQEPTVRFAGVATRAAALGIDAFLILSILTIVSGFVALITSLVGDLRPAWLAGLLLGSGGLLVAVGYLVLFWSSAGRTPGMHLLGLRLRRPSGEPPSVGRSIVRAIGTWISIIPMFAGYLPVLFDSRRRGVPDYLAGTEVVYAEPDG